MSDWVPTPPPSSDLGDHEVVIEGTHLLGKRIALLVTGGIAAMKAPMVARALRRQGAQVTAFLSEEGARYVAVDALAWSCNRPVVTALSSRAEHLSDLEQFDAYLVAPATYNTINKMACGIADGLVTATLASALGRMERGDCSVIVAPTMHGSMHTTILAKNVRLLADLGVNMVPPRDDQGKHNLPDEGVLVSAVCRALSRSPLKGRPVLVTGGPIPAQLDDVRQLSNPFTGGLSVAIAAELTLRGADVNFILGTGSAVAPSWLGYKRVNGITEYREAVMSDLRESEQRVHAGGSGGFAAAVLSAGVADFAPSVRASGKVATDSGWQVDLVPTAKVIDEVRGAFPQLCLVGFKYTVGVPLSDTLRIARARMLGWDAVVANRGEDMSPNTHSAWLIDGSACSSGTSTEPTPLQGRAAIAAGIADFLESRSQAAAVTRQVMASAARNGA
ncbi:MAG: phosphopantothenoylcysteine decarboxylase [Phycisphaerales bacterium]|nr:phosphopantothenoylcysteine decarboxylase [Phycisphaerales bacterium]